MIRNTLRIVIGSLAIGLAASASAQVLVDMPPPPRKDVAAAAAAEPQGAVNPLHDEQVVGLAGYLGRARPSLTTFSSGWDPYWRQRAYANWGYPYGYGCGWPWFGFSSFHFHHRHHGSFGGTHGSHFGSGFHGHFGFTGSNLSIRLKF